MTHSHFFRLLMTTVGVLVGLLALWYLSGLIFLVFGAILVALVLEVVKRQVRRTGLGDTAALTVSVLLIAALSIAFIAGLGTRILMELRNLVDRIPNLLDVIEERLNMGSAEDWIAQRVQEMLSSGSLMSDISGMSTVVVSAMISIFIIFVGGIYFAAKPDLYRTGFLKLIPEGGRERADEAMTATASALRQWMVGQVLSMIAVGVVTTAGLYLLGVPTPVGLGVLAGLLEFIPYIGPIVSAVPAVAVAFAEDPILAVWVIALYFGIQQLEGTLLVPIIQERTVEIPPGLLVFAVLAFGSLFGLAGVVLGAPMTVVVFVLVKLLWVRETLGEKTEVPGEEALEEHSGE